jgi:hypothetical protein
MSWLGFGGTYLLGLAFAALAALITSLMLYTYGLGVGGQFVVFSVYVRCPACDLTAQPESADEPIHPDGTTDWSRPAAVRCAEHRAAYRELYPDVDAPELPEPAAAGEPKTTSGGAER